MDFEATRRLQPEMASTERLMWSGRPPTGLRVRRSDIPTVIFGLTWTGFAVYWTWNIWQEEAQLIPTIVGGLMVMIGLYQFIGRFFLDAYARARTWYGVSDSRVVIVTEVPARNVHAVPLASLPDVTLETEGIDGGLIGFGGGGEESLPALGERRPRRRGRTRGRMRRKHPVFELEHGARSAFDIIRRAQADARRA